MKRWMVLFCPFVCAACGLHVDRPTTIKSGDFPLSEHSVTGEIDVEAGARGGALSSVRGDIVLGYGASAASVRTITGHVLLRAGATVRGDVQTVTGSVSMARNSHVAGRVTSVTGDINLEAAEAGSIETTSGTISLGAASIVASPIVLAALQPGEKNPTVLKLPTVLIGEGAHVEGGIQASRGAIVIASRSAVLGPIRGTTVQRVDDDPTRQ